MPLPGGDATGATSRLSDFACWRTRCTGDHSWRSVTLSEVVSWLGGVAAFVQAEHSARLEPYTAHYRQTLELS